MLDFGIPKELSSMDSNDSEYFETRKPRPTDAQKIRNSNSHADMEFARKVESVFGHHSAIFDPPPHTAGLESPSALAAKFYSDCFPLPKLKRGMGGDELTVEKFLETILSSIPDRKRNCLFYLLGDVGAGKTAFINYLITRYGKQWVNDSILFLRIDIFLVGENEILTPQHLLDDLVEKLLRITAERKTDFALGERTISALDDLKEARKSGDDVAHALAVFARTAREESGKRLLLFIDNIDYLYHLSDRIAFFPNREEEDSAAIKAVAHIVRAFVHDGAGGVLSELGANVIFALRPDSYDILGESLRLFPDPSTLFDQSAFELTSPDWHEVFEGRKGLLEHAIAKSEKPGKQRVLEGMLDAIEADLNERPDVRDFSVIEHLVRLAKFGLRDVMGFFAQYSWLEGTGSTQRDERIGIERLLHSYPVALLAFILGGNRRFNQFRSTFPNIYLVSVQDSDKYGFAEHPHSYWLKRLILEVIGSEQRNNRIVRPRDIVNLFSGQGSGVYMEGLVFACLGSMQDTQVSYLIKTHRRSLANDYRCPIEDITLSRRGEDALENVFDRFFYLQLIVNDYMLPIPRCLHSELQNTSLDYGYFGLPPSQYTEKAREMIKAKASQVLFFLEVLEISLKCEEEKYSRAFLRVKRVLGSAFPDVSRIKSGIEKELERLNANPVMRGLLSVQAIRQAVERKRGAIRDELRKAYRLE
jgi:hypothetical protein